MSDTPSSQDERLRKLREQADALQRGTARTASPHAQASSAAANQGYRIIADLLGGVIVGLALGFGLDRLSGGKTAPWGLIGGVLIGFAVSVWMAKLTADRLVALAKAENGGAPARPAPLDDEDDD